MPQFKNCRLIADRSRWIDRHFLEARLDNFLFADYPPETPKMGYGTPLQGRPS